MRTLGIRADDCKQFTSSFQAAPFLPCDTNGHEIDALLSSSWDLGRKWFSGSRGGGGDWNTGGWARRRRPRFSPLEDLVLLFRQVSFKGLIHLMSMYPENQQITQASGLEVG